MSAEQVVFIQDHASQGGEYQLATKYRRSSHSIHNALSLVCLKNDKYKDRKASMWQDAHHEQPR